MGTNLKCVSEALLMSTYNIHFCREIREILVFFTEKKKAAYVGLYILMPQKAVNSLHAG